MATYKPIQSVALTSATASVTLSGIDQGYTDLELVIWAQSVSGIQNVNMQFNGDTGTRYSRTLVYGDGTSALSVRGIDQTNINAGFMTTTGCTTTVKLFNYSNITTSKTVLSRSGDPTDSVNAGVGLWRAVSNAAINTINITGTGNFAAGSTFSLYGIKSGSPKATGGELRTDGTYWYHTFNTTQMFIPQVSLTADYLVVAGGGGGGSFGGGGAGGYRTSIGGTALSLAANTGVTVTIGAGGAGNATSGTLNSNNNTNGSNSIFSTITSTGGGKGGNYQTSAGGNGGSGGGGSDAAAAGSASPSGQGNNGGTGTFVYGGGGGGAGAVGSSFSGQNAGAGGAGLASSITGTSITRAGGGGGGNWSAQGAAGAGGSGGGGAGTLATTAATSGTINTGGGGGGAGFNNSVTPYYGIGGAGGSGIVIVRYPV